MSDEKFNAEIPERGLTFMANAVRRKRTFPKEEVEQAIARYFVLANEGAKTGDWDPWADLFTEDALYLEHSFGIFRGRDAIRGWVKAATGSKPSDLQMASGWQMIDNDLCTVYALNLLPAPDGGAAYQFNAIAILCYAGDGRFCYEEDLYDSAEAHRVGLAFAAAKEVAG